MDKVFFVFDSFFGLFVCLFVFVCFAFVFQATLTSIHHCDLQNLLCVNCNVCVFWSLTEIIILQGNGIGRFHTRR